MPGILLDADFEFALRVRMLSIRNGSVVRVLLLRLVYELLDIDRIRLRGVLRELLADSANVECDDKEGGIVKKFSLMVGLLSALGLWYLGTISRLRPEATASAQTRSDSSSTSQVPLSIVVLDRGAGGQNPRPAAVRLTNVSGRPVVGYVLKIREVEPSGRAPVVQARTAILGLGKPGARSSFASGEVWNEQFQVSGDGELNVDIDYVRFQPGGAGEVPDWGPNTLHESKGMLAAMNAYRIERARLRRLLEREGLQAVAEDLRTE